MLRYKIKLTLAAELYTKGRSEERCGFMSETTEEVSGRIMVLEI